MATYRGDGVIIDEIGGLLHMAPTVCHQRMLCGRWHVSGIVWCHQYANGTVRCHCDGWSQLKQNNEWLIVRKLLNLKSIKPSDDWHILPWKLNQVYQNRYWNFCAMEAVRIFRPSISFGRFQGFSHDFSSQTSSLCFCFCLIEHRIGPWVISSICCQFMIGHIFFTRAPAPFCNGEFIPRSTSI